MKFLKKDKIVLVTVLKNKRDLDLLLKNKWYRIPVAKTPKKYYDYLAFYQPAIFGRQGKCIKYYARVLDSWIQKRNELLSKELNHPRANDNYYKISFGKIQNLSRSIKNIIPRRICFGFTTLNSLLRARDILQLYNIPPTEQMVENGLRRAGTKFIAQHSIKINKRRFRLDLAIFCQHGKIAIECDNKKAHSGSIQRRRDKIKDRVLKQAGWNVVRLKESQIFSNLNNCLARIKKLILRLT